MHIDKMVTMKARMDELASGVSRKIDEVREKIKENDVEFEKNIQEAKQFLKLMNKPSLKRIFAAGRHAGEVDRRARDAREEPRCTAWSVTRTTKGEERSAGREERGVQVRRSHTERQKILKNERKFTEISTEERRPVRRPKRV